ncbi:cadherin-like beta sandwich domain-containing protein [Anaeromicropila populeti]|uniref:Beta-N-acetylglucosaminidase n=1 Tax=Anaeromicropila populeti TaxID=37658 RepID=A0A1I6IRS3_9FIRM|nr:cadherin-like beta sandwich domain-containing protein [Anaeromicropila populeti]SFR69433.1 Beta-N-acetylglucosaminidase [Anaeromicropila populeti]
MKSNKHRILFCVSCIALTIVLFVSVHNLGRIDSYAASTLKLAGKSTASKVNVRTKPGRTASQMIINEKKVQLSKNQAVTVLKEKVVSGEKWYYISFKYLKKSYRGYVLSNYVKLTLKTSASAAVSAKTSQKIVTKAGGSTYKKVSGKVVSLKKGTAVTVLKESTVSKKKWFYISFVYKKKTYKGYILADSVSFVIPETTKTGSVAASRLNVRTGAGTTYPILEYKEQKVQLTKGTLVTIVSEKKVDTVLWYQVKFSYESASLKGYVSGEFIQLTTKTAVTPLPEATPTPEITEIPEVTSTPEITETPEITPEPTPEITPVPTVTPVPTALTDAEFEAALMSEGFPEDYKAKLRLLHQQYPLWQFKAYHTGYDWNTVIEKESVVGKNLITNAKSIAWKSIEAGAYNWSTDSFIPFDGSTWVTVSKEGLAYYMDPRNFLTTDGIFQFEHLAYNEQYQTKSGVESILSNTVMGNKSYTYLDEAQTETSTTYGDTFIAAAKYSNVNPFHLATRVKQEVATSTGLSASATGQFAGYEGYYNFYNIGATHSTVAGGAIANGLSFAKTGGSYSQANKDLFLIPWTSPYRSIVGGAKFIGNNYINKGQDTVYLQKFNLSNYSTFSHQYMANVEAARAEAQKTYTAYKNFTDIPVVFYIPVYYNMPAAPCPVPSGGLNPNNWLKKLSVIGQTMTPTFQVSDAVNTSYTVIVDSSVTSVTIEASAVSSKATVVGNVEYPVNIGVNTIPVVVTAENGQQRTYEIYVIKNA